MSDSDHESNASESITESDKTTEPPRKKLRFSTDEGPEIELKPITILVGSKGDEFYIHEKLSRSASALLDNALKKEEWKKGHDRIVRLPDVAPPHFKIWMKWLYTGRLFVKKDGDDEEVDGRRTISAEWLCLRNCYGLGDFLQDPDFKDATIDAFIDRMVETKCFPTALAEYIYSHSNRSSVHRQLAIDVFVRFWETEGYTDILTENENDAAFQPRQFLCDVLVYIGPHMEEGLEHQELKDFFNLNDTCKYHEHGPEKPCYKTKPAFCF